MCKVGALSLKSNIFLREEFVDTRGYKYFSLKKEIESMLAWGAHVFLRE